LVLLRPGVLVGFAWVLDSEETAGNDEFRELVLSLQLADDSLSEPGLGTRH